MRKSAALALLAVTVCTPAGAQTVNLRPGSYETTAEIDMPGMKMPAQKDVQCITSEDLKDLSKKMIHPEQAAGCTVSDYKVSGNKVTFNTTCKDGDTRVTMSMEMTYAAESFSGVIKSKDDAGRTMTIRTSAKRVGDCTKGS